jgi:hypothetical protein
VKLETPRLDEFCALTRVAGCEVWFTIRTPSGEAKQLDVNALFREVHQALHSLHHFMDPDGAHHTGFPHIPSVVKPEDNPTGRAALGHPET